jgi:DNA-binding transcriptional LysR family regulator
MSFTDYTPDGQTLLDRLESRIALTSRLLKQLRAAAAEVRMSSRHGSAIDKALTELAWLLAEFQRDRQQLEIRLGDAALLAEVSLDSTDWVKLNIEP